MEISSKTIDIELLKKRMISPDAGAYTSFEGWVRNENEGRRVIRLEYEVYDFLAVKEGKKIIHEACEQFSVINADCIHREGVLEIGDCAVWVGAVSPHRNEAFLACRYIIDQVKIRLPIWKKEHYFDGDSGWVKCERCSEGIPV